VRLSVSVTHRFLINGALRQIISAFGFNIVVP
jgi:hypothetical protein